LEKGGPAQERLNEHHLHVWSQQRQHDPRQARAGTKVRNAPALGQQWREPCTVQNVARPQPLHLAWSEEAPDYAWSSKEVGIGARTIERVTKDSLRTWRRFRGGSMR
jgi:hypothetical protein